MGAVPQGLADHAGTGIVRAHFQKNTDAVFPGPADSGGKIKPVEGMRQDRVGGAGAGQFMGAPLEQL